MHRDHRFFIEAVKNRKKVSITIQGNSQCNQYRPLFYIPTAGKEGYGYYYVWAGEKEGICRLEQEQIVSIELTQELFEPSNFNLVSTEIPPKKDSSQLKPSENMQQ